MHGYVIDVNQHMLFTYELRAVHIKYSVAVVPLLLQYLDPPPSTPQELPPLWIKEMKGIVVVLKVNVPQREVPNVCGNYTHNHSFN